MDHLLECVVVLKATDLVCHEEVPYLIDLVNLVFLLDGVDTILVGLVQFLLVSNLVVSAHLLLLLDGRFLRNGWLYLAVLFIKP